MKASLGKGGEIYMALHIDLDPTLRVSVSTECHGCDNFSPLTTNDFGEGGNLFNLGRAVDHVKKAPGHAMSVAIKPIDSVVYINNTQALDDY